MTTLSILGIDVAKDTLDVCLLHRGQTHQQRFDNTPSGHRRLRRWLHKQRVRLLHTCLEATGLYGEELALTLHEAGYQVSVVNPLRVKKYAESQLQRHKTDRLDAWVIADFARSQETRAWTPPPLEWRETGQARITWRAGFLGYGLREWRTSGENTLSVLPIRLMD